MVFMKSHCFLLNVYLQNVKNNKGRRKKSYRYHRHRPGIWTYRVALELWTFGLWTLGNLDSGHLNSRRLDCGHS